jgi:hypothetical protein
LASPDVHLTQQSERTGREQNWFALTGRNAEANEVLPLFSMEDKANAFTASADLRQAMEKAGVSDNPYVYFLK